MVESEGALGGDTDTKVIINACDADLAALARSPFIIGDIPIQEINRPNARPLWVRFEEDGAIFNRMYRTNSAWKARVTSALKEGRSIQALEFDEWGRLKTLFPTEVTVRLKWNAGRSGDLAPVARLFDPNGDAELLLLRSLGDGHAVEVVHNVTEVGSVRQPVWVADIMRLNPLLGMKLIRDEAF